MFFASCEQQFITTLSVHQNPNDGTCLKEHLKNLVFTPRTITADSAFWYRRELSITGRSGNKKLFKVQYIPSEQTLKYKSQYLFERKFFL